MTLSAWQAGNRRTSTSRNGGGRSPISATARSTSFTRATVPTSGDKESHHARCWKSVTAINLQRAGGMNERVRADQLTPGDRLVYRRDDQDVTWIVVTVETDEHGRLLISSPRRSILCSAATMFVRVARDRPIPDQE